LSKTIYRLNSGSIKPNEILVCLPNNSHSLDSVSLGHNNVKIVLCNAYGQVFQRSVGFKLAQYEYVLQLDDDILIDEFCIERLLHGLELLSFNSCISPVFLDQNKSPMHQKKSGFIARIYYQIINGKHGHSPGKITLAGTNFGVNFGDFHKNILEVEWQPGGCILHRKKNLIYDNFFPYKGKAFCEDLIHSFFLKEAGIRMYVTSEATCSTNSSSKLKFTTEIIRDIKARYYFVKLAKLSKTRMFIYYFFYLIRKI